MAAGTVVSGGFPGRVAQEVQPNQKCNGCLHFDGQAGRIGACTIGLRPWLCGDGGAADIGYAPISQGAGSYLPGMSNHDAQAHDVETQFVSSLYGAGSTRPVEVQQMSLGAEHVHFVKSLVSKHMETERQMCRLHQGHGQSYGVSPYTNAPQSCSCVEVTDMVVAKALVGQLNNRQRAALTREQLFGFVHDQAGVQHTVEVAKAFKVHGPDSAVQNVYPTEKRAKTAAAKLDALKHPSGVRHSVKPAEPHEIAHAERLTGKPIAKSEDSSPKLSFRNVTGGKYAHAKHGQYFISKEHVKGGTHHSISYKPHNAPHQHLGYHPTHEAAVHASDVHNAAAKTAG